MQFGSDRRQFNGMGQVFLDGHALPGFTNRAHASKKIGIYAGFYTFFRLKNGFCMICLDQKDVKR
ncbi:MAG: hypothetical protein ACI83P_002087 [Janthinobacterium sp.]|jgi:hypothetical protein